MSSHKSLLVWNRSIAMVKALYLITQKFPLCELYGITSQMRRAAISIPSNIAEGYARAHDKELLHFLYISFFHNEQKYMHFSVMHYFHHLCE